MKTFNLLSSAYRIKIRHELNKWFYMEVLEELRSKPDIRINQEVLDRLDRVIVDPQHPEGMWPDQLDQYHVLKEVISYKGVPLSLFATLNGGSVTVKFPRIIQRNSYIWPRTWNATTHKYEPNQDSNVTTSQRGQNTNASVHTNTDDLYDEIVKAHKRYLQKVRKIEALNQKDDALRVELERDCLAARQQPI